MPAECRPLLAIIDIITSLLSVATLWCFHSERKEDLNINNINIKHYQSVLPTVLFESNKFELLTFQQNISIGIKNTLNIIVISLEM